MVQRPLHVAKLNVEALSGVLWASRNCGEAKGFIYKEKIEFAARFE